MDSDLIKRIREGWLPLFACDELLWEALRLACGDPQIREELMALFYAEGTAPQPRALFQYLFVPAGSPAAETRDCIAGFCLREREDRLRHAKERLVALVADDA